MILLGHILDKLFLVEEVIHFPTSLLSHQGRDHSYCLPWANPERCKSSRSLCVRPLSNSRSHAHSVLLYERVVIYKHALRNALIPTFTVIGIYMSILIGGSVLTEIIFRRPGLGKMMVFEVKDRNYIAFQSVVIIFSAFVFLFNLLTDLLYSIIDLRIEYR